MATVDGFILVVAFIAVLGCALMAGLFFAFSVAVMKALARIPAVAGIAAMQSINVVIVNRTFLGAFFGTGLASVALIVLALLRWQQPGAAYLLAGGALYLVGTLIVTMIFNVPRNNALARVTAGDAAAASVWRDYLKGWTAWNHVRTVASLAATAAFTLALWFGQRPA